MLKTETSVSSPIRIAKITPESEKHGWVAITLAPGKKTMGTFNYWDRDLALDLDRLVDFGTHILVCFLEDDELSRLHIPDLLPRAEERGLQVKRFPFHDGGVPRDMSTTMDLVQDICNLYRKGRRLVMHCNGGLGRAGTIGACVRLALGLDSDPEQAIAAIRKARSHRAIETTAQEAFVARFHGALQEMVRRGGC